MTELASDRMPKVDMANSIIDDINIVARALRNTLINPSQETIAAEFDRIANLRDAISCLISQKG